MNEADLMFLEENIINFETVKLGYTRNIPFDVLRKYEIIYKQYIDKQYILTYWCSSCVMEMLKRLMHYYDLEKNN